MTTLLLLPVAAAFLAAAAQPNDYGKPESWLCRPGRTTGDACAASDLSTTIVPANGKVKTEKKWKANPKAPVDCFYVYPTVSLDATANSDMIAGDEERRVIQHQFARFASQCRVYAPLYRQLTLRALQTSMTGRPMPVDRALIYNDVRDAWRHYLQHDNQGRGFVLIGHSQGSSVLMQLIREEIDGKPVQDRLISAFLLGTNLAVPKGQDVGGTFRKVPLCRSESQTGCAVAYASFRAKEPPPRNTRYGKVTGDGMTAACVNPAALAGGAGPLRAYLGSGARTIATVAAQAPEWVKPAPAKPIATAFVSVPGLLTSECVTDANGTYLAVTVHGDPADPRADDIPGDVIAAGVKQANWGLHLIDVNLAMGNLVDLVATQSKAYLATKRRASR